MGPDLELQGKSKASMEFSVTKENTIPTEGPEDRLLQCSSNCEDNSFGTEALLVERSTELDASGNIEVNITDSINGTDAGLVESECQNASEHSSSFGDTESGTESGWMFAGDEVESHLCATNVSLYDGCFDTLSTRKKKLTVHWRKFIHPLMWRCKWIELQMKELQSQALKYDRELAAYDRRKQFEFESFTLAGCDAKSLPFSRQILRDKVMKRKKRERVEETVDIKSYMSQHSLFSYYENKRSVADAAFIEGNGGNLDKIINGHTDFGINEGWSSFEFGSGDNSLEQILWKIELAHSKVRKMKTQIDKVISETPSKYSSVNKLSLPVPCDVLNSSDQNPASPPDNGPGLLARSLFTSSRPVSECSMNPLSGIIGSMDQSQVGGVCENTEDEILIHNQAVKEELDDCGQVRSWLNERPQVWLKQPKTIPQELPAGTGIPKVQSNVKSCSTSKPNLSRNTRRRGRRKAGSKRWSKRSLA